MTKTTAGPTSGLMESLIERPTAVTIVGALLLLLVGFALGVATVSLFFSSDREAATEPAALTVPSGDEFVVPELDAPGADVDGLPRFPGSVRIEYRQSIYDGLMETEVEYVIESTMETVHDHYRRVFDEEGWSVADLEVYQGEWTFFVVSGEREGLVEIEARGPLVEIEIEISEPPSEAMRALTICLLSPDDC